MKKLILILASLFTLGLAVGAASAQTVAPLQGFCEVGGVKVLTSGSSSSTFVQASYPKCTVTVYQTGTTNLATIYSNTGLTPLANPFIAQTNGSWLLYATLGEGVDIVLSGGTPNAFPSPYTLINKSPGGGGGGGGVSQIIAGSNINITPSGGTGAVTINSSGGSGSTGGIDTDNFITNPPGNNGIANTVANIVCLGTPSCYAITPSTSTSTEVPTTYQLVNIALGQFGTHTTDYRGGAQVDTWNSPINPLAIEGAPSIRLSAAMAHLDFLNSLVAVPGQTFPEYGFSRTYENFLVGGNNTFRNGPPAGKTNYLISGDTAFYPQPGQHLGRTIVQDCTGAGDCLVGNQSFGVCSGSSGEDSDEGCHKADVKIQEALPLVVTCIGGCTTGSTSISLNSLGNNQLGVGLIIQDFAHITNPNCRISGQTFQAFPQTSVSFAGSSCVPVSQMFLAASACTNSNVYQNGACGATNQAIATTSLPSGFLSSTSGVPSTGVACVSTSNDGNRQNDQFEMANYTITDGTHIQLTYTQPHPLPAIISIGGSCGLSLVPWANVSGTVSQITTNNAPEQAVMGVGSPDANTLYIGNYAALAAVGQFADSRVFYAQLTPVTIVGNGTTATISISGETYTYNGLTATISGASPSGFNGTVPLTQTGTFTLTYPSTATGTATGSITITINYAQYSLVPAAIIADIVNPVTHQFDGSNIQLNPNTVQFSLGSNPLVVPTGSQLGVSGTDFFSEITQSTPRKYSFDPTFGSYGDGETFGGMNGPSLNGYKLWNTTPFSAYTEHGGTLGVPKSAFSIEGLWSADMTMYAPDFAVIRTYCKNFFSGCSDFNSGYNLFYLEQLDNAANFSSFAFYPPTNTFSFGGGSSASTLQVENLNATGVAILPNLQFPSGIKVGPSTTIPGGDGSEGLNYAFLDSTQTVRQTLGIKSIFITDGGGLVIGFCGQFQDGNSPYCATPASSILTLSTLNAGFGSLMNGLSIGLGIPIYEPVATAAVSGAVQYGYFLEGCNAAGQCTPLGQVGNSVLTSALSVTNTISIACPAALQNGYPVGMRYKLVRDPQTMGAIPRSNLGTCTVGTTFIDDGSITTAEVAPTVNYTALLGAGSIIDAEMTSNAGNCAQYTTGGQLASSGSPCGSGGGGGVTSINGNGGVFTFTGSGVSCTSTTCTFSTGPGTVTAVSSGSLGSIFTTSVATSTTTPAISYTLSTQSANSVFGNFTSGTAAPTFSTTPVFSAATLTNFPTFNQNTTGSAGSLLTSRNLAGNAFNGTANVPFVNKFIVQGTSDAGLTGAQFLGSLATGIVKNTTSTGVLSIAAAGTDYLTPSGSATGLSKASNVAFGVSQCDGITIICPGGVFSGLGGTGTVTHTAGALTALHLMLGNGASDSKVDSVALTDGAGNMTAASYTTANTAVASVVQITPNTHNTVTGIGTCNSAAEGSIAPVTDASVNTWGSTPSGGGTDHVLLYCSGAAWKVMGQ